jgi:hypothetical protein
MNFGKVSDFGASARLTGDFGTRAVHASAVLVKIFLVSSNRPKYDEAVRKRRKKRERKRIKRGKKDEKWVKKG